MVDSSTANGGGRSWRSLLVLITLGIMAGLGLAGWGLSRSPTMRDWLFGAPQQPVQPVITYQPQAPAPTAPAVAGVLPEPVDDGFASRLADIESRLARVEGATTSGRDSAKAEGLLIAFAARRALEKGMALGYVEGELTRQFGASQPRAVSMIIAAARQPVTLDRLGVELDRLTPELVGTPAEESLWEGIKRSVSSLIIVREAGAPSPDPAEQVARARALISTGQVGQALAEVSRMPTRGVAEKWMADARRLVEAQRALDLLEAAAILPAKPEAAEPAVKPTIKPELKPEAGIDDRPVSSDI